MPGPGSLSFCFVNGASYARADCPALRTLLSFRDGEELLDVLLDVEHFEDGNESYGSTLSHRGMWTVGFLFAQGWNAEDVTHIAVAHVDENSPGWRTHYAPNAILRKLERVHAWWTRRPR